LTDATDNRIPRVWIEAVTPAVDGGRHAAKRLVGETCRVGADIFKDGHDRLRARILYRGPADRDWNATPLEHAYDPDRWFGSFRLEQIGRWRFRIEAWTDRWGTWVEDLGKRVAAGQDVASELSEGAALLERAAQRVPEDCRETLRRAAARLEDASVPLDARIALTASPELEAQLAAPLFVEDVTRYPRTFEIVVDRRLAGFGSWYEMFPRSQAAEFGRHGTFADAERRLPELAELGFDVIYLPPIHPIGRTHRKGRNNTPRGEPGDPGSPWAIGAEQGGHTAVHPELGTLADFERFVRRAKSLGLEVALDYALQCSADHPWLRAHPDWFHVRPDGTIRYAENPPKKYQDIYPLDFWCADYSALWEACRQIFEFWIARGVTAFRVDNPHTKPLAFWEWMIPELKRAHPEVILLSEAFTRPKRMKALAKLGFTQSYTYFTWKNTSWELREYFEELSGTDMTEYFRPNLFTNTPDILHAYLQQGGRPAFRVRLLLAGTLSPLYGIYSGFELCENVPLREGSEEYLDSEKYELRWRDWNTPGNIKADIARLNRLRREQPALQSLSNLQFLPAPNEQILCYQKGTGRDALLIVVNLDPQRVQETAIDATATGAAFSGDAPFELEDLLSGERYTWQGARHYVRLDPADKVGHVLRRTGSGNAPRA
jgi:starch synthase (maltosyl-transferring)